MYIYIYVCVCVCVCVCYKSRNVDEDVTFPNLPYGYPNEAQLHLTLCAISIQQQYEVEK